MLTLIGKEEISDEDLLKCQQIIYNLIAFEARHEPLTLPVGQHRYFTINLIFLANYLMNVPLIGYIYKYVSSD